MSAPSNRPTLDHIRTMPIGEIVTLPAEHLALLQEDASEALKAAKRQQDWIESAIALRYEQRAIAARGSAGKDTGTVRFVDDGVEIVADLPKKVEWDQDRLAVLVEQIRASGENPSDYVVIDIKVPERAYTSWPERIRKAFQPARTVHTGRQTFKLTLKPGAV